MSGPDYSIEFALLTEICGPGRSETQVIRFGHWFDIASCRLAITTPDYAGDIWPERKWRAHIPRATALVDEHIYDSFTALLDDLRRPEFRALWTGDPK